MTKRTSSPPVPAAAPPAGSRVTRDDLRRFRGGTHYSLREALGAHPSHVGDTAGVAFAVWAPHAERVSVVGSFNDWDPERNPLRHLGSPGVWSGFIEGVDRGALYKYHVESTVGGYTVDKADPCGILHQTPPDTASVVWSLEYDWRDADWLDARARRNAADAPMSIYEVHLGSWRRRQDDGSRSLGYRELADELVDHVARMNFTHVELLPPLEHPFYGSWGYQTTGYFAPTSRYGSPQDLMYLIDRLHRRGIGVILDWVPSHFPSDAHGLAFFDGTRLFEYPDPRVGYQPDWKSYIFNYGRKEVQSFLISSALFWLERYHVDAIRVDAVASMLYLDYSRDPGQWIRNKYGGRENLEAIDFLRRLNLAVHKRHPGVKMIAEESTAWPMVSRPVHLGGLGFDMKWDMGWMHDTLEYMRMDPIHRKFHHDKITFRAMYAFSENFVLSLSHDEVVHGKASLIGKMAGDEWQRFAGLRALLGYMYGQPGKKLLFMGAELGQWREWDHERGLDWDLLQYPAHEGLRQWVEDLNRLYRAEPALHRRDFDSRGFRWVDCSDAEQSVVCFTRHAEDDNAAVLVLCNFTPVPRHNYRVGVPQGGTWQELLNSDAEVYGGSGQGNLGRCEATPMRYHELPHSLVLSVPPLSVVFLKRGTAGPALPFAAD
jgi:1,4-alpha-glucan branching enzyme